MSTGFTFGAKPLGTTGTSSFGTPTLTNQLSFGAKPQQQQPMGFQFGSTFDKPTGAVAPQTGGFTLGAPTTSANTAFGAPAAAPSLGTGLTFGAAPISSVAPTLNFGLGNQKPEDAAPGLSFNAPATTGTGFGSILPQTTAAISTFGVPSTSNTAPSLNFATSAPSTGFSLGAAATTTASTSLGATPTLGFGVTSSTAGSQVTSASGLSFMGPSPVTKAPTLNFNLTTTTSAAPGLSFGTSAPSTGFSLTTTSTAPAAKVGLGGIQTSTTSSSGTATAKEVPPKEQQVPNEIQQDIENFKSYTKQQKLYSSDVSRCCVKDFRSVEAQIGVLNNVIKEIESQVERNRSLAEKLKYDTAQGLQLLEMAQRTQDIPAGLQYENVAPMNFFLNLADNFEKEMQALKIQIENTDDYVKNCGQPATLTSQDLSLGMKRLHDTFVALAGRLQSVHTQVESQKELYINLRKQLTNDSNNPFESLDKKLNSTQSVSTSVNHSPPKIACGPTPFSQIMTSNFPISAQQNLGATYPAMASGFGTGSSGTELFSMNKSSTMFPTAPASSSFQLQKPPTGNKRGKQ